MSDGLRLGIGGLGVVGGKAVRLFQENAALYAERAGQKIDVVAVSARDSKKDRGVDLSQQTFFSDPVKMVEEGDINVYVEVIGGEDGPALESTRAALSLGIPVVTANKAMLAYHGFELAQLAEAKNVGLSFEAAVAGGIPGIKALRDGLAANNVEFVRAILNGTTNYILTQMRERGMSYEDALAEAQELGYVEADESLDLDGKDAAHKLTLLTSIAFGVKPDYENLLSRTKGIRDVSSTDIEHAKRFGHRIKLLGHTRNVNGQILQTIQPYFVPEGNQLYTVDDGYNGIFVRGDAVEDTFFCGKGAGGGPTASAVIADVIDLARGVQIPTFGVTTDKLVEPQFMDPADAHGSFYMRFGVADDVGVLSEVTDILGKNGVSVKTIWQPQPQEGRAASIVLMTKETTRGAVYASVAEIDALESSIEKSVVYPIASL